jgi:hypothetical protein
LIIVGYFNNSSYMQRDSHALASCFTDFTPRKTKQNPQRRVVMVNRKGLVVIAGFFLLLSSMAEGQINLNAFTARAVRSGYTLPAQVESLWIDTRVKEGQAVTRVTLSVYPDTCQNSMFLTSRDSIEISNGFYLPRDFVADSMWLWINGVPVPAAIQDRRLAANQYNQIVGVRRDPALLETPGNGCYSLRIFPTIQSNARKIRLQFHHTFSDAPDSGNAGGGLIIAKLPIVFDTLKKYSYYPYRNAKPIVYVQYSCAAEDHNGYFSTLPGLGSDRFRLFHPLVLHGAAVTRLQAGFISTEDPSENENTFLWTGTDVKNQKRTMGFSLKLSPTDMSLSPEPETRIIVIDVRNATWNWNRYNMEQALLQGCTYTPYDGSIEVPVWERAQKFALLALRSYVNEQQRFNIVFAGKKPRSLFKEPVQGTVQMKMAASMAIMMAAPDAQANTSLALAEAVTQAQEGAIIVISDLYSPAMYTICTNGAQGDSSKVKSFESLIGNIGGIMRNNLDHTFFYIGDCGLLASLCKESGGFTLGSLFYDYWLPYINTSETVSHKAPLLQPLFGTGSPSGMSRISIQSPEADDIVYSLEAMNPLMIRYVGIIAAPYSIPGDQLLRVAGRAPIHWGKKSVPVTMSGKIGGLRWTKQITGIADAGPMCPSRPVDQDVQWAFRKCESFSMYDISAAETIKQTGKEYHIVTPQTSLLALEPGVKLWEDTLGATNSQQTPVTGGVTVLSIMPNPSGAIVIRERAGLSIDSLSFADLLAESGISGGTNDQPLGNPLQLMGKKVVFTVPSFITGQLTLSLYDLSGRRITSRSVDASHYTGIPLVWDISGEWSLGAPGQYIVRISGKSYERVYKIGRVGK